MVVVSILRLNQHVPYRKWLQRTMTVLHIVGVPLMLAAMAWYVNGLSMADK